MSNLVRVSLAAALSATLMCWPFARRAVAQGQVQFGAGVVWSRDVSQPPTKPATPVLSFGDNWWWTSRLQGGYDFSLIGLHRAILTAQTYVRFRQEQGGPVPFLTVGIAPPSGFGALVHLGAGLDLSPGTSPFRFECRVYLPTAHLAWRESRIMFRFTLVLPND